MCFFTGRASGVPLRLHKDDELLEKCPDSGYNYRLRGRINKMSKEEKQRFLEKVMKEHPKTRSAKFAEQLLRSLKRGEYWDDETNQRR